MNKLSKYLCIVSIIYFTIHILIFITKWIREETMKTIKVTKKGIAKPEIAKQIVKNANCGIDVLYPDETGRMRIHHNTGNFEVMQVNR